MPQSPAKSWLQTSKAKWKERESWLGFPVSQRMISQFKDKAGLISVAAPSLQHKLIPGHYHSFLTLLGAVADNYLWNEPNRLSLLLD